MPDREKLVIAIERAKEQSEEYGLDRILVDFKAVDMILELLKEQDAIESIDFGDRTDIMANLESLTWDDWRMYHSDTEVQNIAKSVFDLLIALMKEQEAVKPILKREAQNKYYNDYVCPRCDSEVVYEQKFCSECGVPFIWEGR